MQKNASAMNKEMQLAPELVIGKRLLGGNLAD